MQMARRDALQISHRSTERPLITLQRPQLTYA